MRVFFTAVPLYGHLLPILPLARAARASGDKVVVSTHESMVSAASDLPTVTAEAPIAPLLGSMPIIDVLLKARVDLSFDGVLAAARAFRPDVIVAESTDFVAPLVASALGVPWVAHGITMQLRPGLISGFAEGLRRRFADHHLEPVERAAFVDIWPGWLQPAGFTPPRDTLPMRPEPYDDPAAPAFAPQFPAGAGRPTILLTLGTVVSDHRLLNAAMDELASLDVNVVVTVGSDADVEDRHLRRGRVVATRFTPIGRLLDEVSVVVAAGGAGTVLAALARGRPMVLKPVLADQPRIAERVGLLKAAVVCDELGQLGPAVTTVLDDPQYREAAMGARQRLETTPTPANVWKRLRTFGP